MENEKRKTENEERGLARRNSAASQFSSFSRIVCSACGTQATREYAKFCRVCGKYLLEDYQPLDHLRASYRLQGQSFLVENANKKEITNLFESDENSISQTAWACVVYSFVPYLGILFVPLAFFVGGFGYFVSYRQPQLGGRKLALACVGLSYVILVVQIYLWWLLYIIPELGKI